MPGSRDHWSAAPDWSRFGLAPSSDERSCAPPSEAASLLESPWAVPAVPAPAPGEIASGCLVIERLRDCLVGHHVRRGPEPDRSGSDPFGEACRAGFAATSFRDDGKSLIPSDGKAPGWVH